MADPTEATEAETEGAPPAKNWRRDLEDRLSAAEARATAAEHKLAYQEAGLSSLSEKQRKALEAAHEGDFVADGLKATAEELGFVKAAAEEQSTSSTEAESSAPDPTATAEAQEMANLASSPATSQASPDVIRTQEAFDAKVRSFTNEADLDAFLRENLSLLPQGRTS